MTFVYYIFLYYFCPKFTFQRLNLELKFFSLLVSGERASKRWTYYRRRNKTYEDGRGFISIQLQNVTWFQTFLLSSFK